MKRLGVAILLAASLPAAGQDAPKTDWAEAWRFDGKAVVGVNFSPDGRQLAISGRNYAAVHSFPDGGLVKSFLQYELVDEAVYSTDGKLLVTRSSTQDSVVHETKDYSKLKFALETAVTGHDGARNSRCPAAFSPDGRWLVLSSGGKGVRFWKLDGLEEPRPFVFEAGWADLPLQSSAENLLLPHVNCFAFRMNEVWLGFDGGYVYPFPVGLPEDEWRLFQYRRSRGPEPVSKDQATARTRAVVVTKTLAQKGCFKPHEKSVSSMEMLGDETLVTAGWEGKVKFWKVAQELRDFPPPISAGRKAKAKQEPIDVIDGYAVEASRDQSELAIAEAWAVRIIDARTKLKLARIEASPSLGRPARMRFSPGGAYLAVTYCCCSDCIDDNVIRLTTSPPRRVHHHGGTLVVYKRP